MEEALARALKDFYGWKVRFDESDEAYAGRTKEHFPEGQAGKKEEGDGAEGNYPTGKKRYDRSPP